MGEGTRTLAGGLVLVALIAWLCAPLLRGERIVVERDGLSAVLPGKAFLADALAARELPTWNPSPALGKPFLADPLPGALYPGNLLLLARPLARGFNLFLSAHLAWTAVGALLFLRRAGLGVSPALLGALVWTLGGATLSLANVVNHLAAVAWLPWVLLGWSLPHSAAGRVALSSVAMAMPFLDGSPEMVALAAAALLLWSRDPRAIAVPLLGAGLAAVAVVPILAYLAETWRGAHGIPPAAAARFAATPSQLLQIVVARSGLEPAPFLASIYVGVVPAALAFGALAWLPRRRAFALGALAVLVALVALGNATPLFPWLFARVPLASLVRYPGKLLVALHAMLAAGAAFGFAWSLEWLRGPHPGRGVRALSIALALAVPSAVAADLLRANGALLSGDPVAAVLDPPPIALAMRKGSPGAIGSASPSGARIGFSGLPGPRYYSNAAGMPAPDDAGAALRQDRDALFASTGELFGLANVNAPSSLNLVVHERLQQALAAAGADRATSALAALGTAWVTAWQPLEAPLTRAVPVRGDPGGVLLYRLERPAARAFVASRIAVVPDSLTALGRFVLTTAGAHDGLAVLEEGQMAGASGAADAKMIAEVAAGPTGPLVDAGRPPLWLESTPDRIGLEVDLDRAGLLVVNDSFASGWSARVDGAPATLLRVNGLVRGLALGPGRHRVSMAYSPPGLGVGAAVSLASVLAVLGLGIRATAHRRSDPNALSRS